MRNTWRLKGLTDNGRVIGITIALVGVASLVVPILCGAFVISLRMPVDGYAGVYPGRLTIYFRSTQNYTGEGIFVPNDSTDPYNCAGDNGTHVWAGSYGGLKVYSKDGTLLYGEPMRFQGEIIPKIDSGIMIWDWEFGGSW
jgi:hypothetical protein